MAPIISFWISHVIKFETPSYLYDFVVTRQHKSQAADDSRKKKRLKMEMWEIEGEGVEGVPQDKKTIDIKDVEFQMANDMKKVQV